MHTQRVSLGAGFAGPRVAGRVQRTVAARALVVRTRAMASAVQTGIVSKTATASVQGTSRRQNEDRLVQETLQLGGQSVSYAAVFDGHGGYATSDWLQNNLAQAIDKAWVSGGEKAEADIAEAFRKADAKLLSPQGGFLGMGERGVGGSKCGSTAAVAIIFQDKSGAYKLLSANVGDARVLLVRGGKVLQLSEDHVPDNEQERDRIEATNPNKKMPLVRYIGGTWRVGGLLALSRAFGDAYLKSTMQFEGVPAGSDGYSSGFGVVAEPYTQLIDLTADDTHLVVCSDGLFANEERGGGGGLPNEEVAAMCTKVGDGDLKALAYEMTDLAQQAGSTDDISTVILKLNVPRQPDV